MNKKDKISLTIEIDERTMKRLEKQIEAFKTGPFSAKQYSNVSSVEDLIAILAYNLAYAEDEFSKVQEKMGDVMRSFEEKGINLDELFKSVFKSSAKDEKDKKTTEKKETPAKKEDDETKRKIYKKD